MIRMRIISENLIDDATLSASPAMVSTLPETNLQLLSRSRVARTTSTADQAIKGNLSSPAIVASLVLWRHNLSAQATVRLRLYDGINQTGTLVYDSGAVAPYTYKSLGDLSWGIDPLEDNVFDEWNVYWSTMWFDPVAAASLQIDLSDSSNPDGYMEISRATLGPTLSASCNPAYGFQVGWDEKVKQERTAGGTLRTDPATNYRTMRFLLDALDESDRSAFLEFTRVVGMRRDFFISIYPEVGGKMERDHSMLAKFTQASPQTHNFYTNYTHTLQLQET